MTFFRFSALMLLASFISQCKQPTAISTTAYVIGPNDISTLTPENDAKVPPDVLAAAVLLTITINQGKRKFCSGTIIPGENGSNFRILTNHHCFAPEEDDKRKVTDELVADACGGARVFFGFFRHDLERREVGRCLNGSFRSDLQGDLGVFTLAQNPSGRFKAAEFWSEGDVPPGRQGLIVHFPAVDATDVDADKNLVLDPEAGIKLPVAQITLNDCETIGPFPAQEWTLDKSLKMGFKHSCDLKKGSSGSGLWDAATGKLLGVNWGGITLKYTDPDRTEVYNVATNINYVKLFLDRKEAEELKRLDAIETDNKNATSADAVANTSGGGGDNKTLDSKKMKGCGAIGIPEPNGSRNWLWLTALFVPLVVVRSKRFLEN